MAEDQYPENQDPIFSKSDLAIDLLRWNRKTDKALLDSSVYDRICSERKASGKRYNSRQLQIIRGKDTFSKIRGIEWVTNICLQAVQKALESSDRNISSLLFTSQDSTTAASVHSSVASRRTHSKKSNIEGLFVYHSLILVQHPWEPPKDLDRLISSSEPTIRGTRMTRIRPGHRLRNSKIPSSHSWRVYTRTHQMLSTSCIYTQSEPTLNG